jgi:membrane fusion protein (multidrug efflux system)
MPAAKTRRVFGLILLAGVLAVGTAVYFYRDGSVTTDNAYLRADITTIAPKVGGYVTEILVEDNQPVTAGQVLFRIEDDDYRAKLAQADANVAAAEAKAAGANAEIDLQQSIILQAEAQNSAAAAELELADKTITRRRNLVLTSAISRAEVDESESALSKASAGLASAKAGLEAQRQKLTLTRAQQQAAVAAVKQAKAARDLAKIDLENTIVRSPITGQVGNRQVRLGRLVAPGVSLLDIVPVQDVWVVANFKETQMEGIEPGMRARIKVDGFPDVLLPGKVESVAPGSGSTFTLLPPDNASGNFVRVVQRVPVKIRFEDHPMLKHVIPGLSARVSIEPLENQP